MKVGDKVTVKGYVKMYTSGNTSTPEFDKNNELVSWQSDIDLNTAGYATYSKNFALDFTDYETADYSAWAVKSISGNTITFEQITTVVPAITGILLKGNDTATLNASAEAGTAPTDNLLEAITVATNIEANAYYGLSGDKFVKVNAGTVPAGKALLPASEVPSEVKSFTFVFNGADGIQRVEQVSAEEAGAIFNLAGQRMSKMQRGINIVNGKKVLVK